MKITSIKCPECKASLDVDEERKQVYCMYCGTKVTLENENEFIYRHVDEASIKQTEADSLLRMKELEMEEKENERSRKGLIIAYAIAAVIAAIGLICVLCDRYDGALFIAIGYVVAMFTFMFQMNKKKKRRHAASENETQISIRMRNYLGEKFNTVVALYKAAGFANVTTIPLCDLNIFTSRKNGQVEEVTINGSRDFEVDDVFPKSAAVTILYHSRK